MLKDDEVIGLVRNLKFKGSFSGMKNFQLFLETYLNEHVSLQRLYNVMKNYPNYQHLPTETNPKVSCNKLCH